MPSLDEDFELPLRRPYAPLAISAALITPLALFTLLYDFPRRRNLTPISLFLVEHPLARQSIAVFLLVVAAMCAWMVFAAARHPRFSIVATSEGIVIPRLLLSKAALARWGAITDVRVNPGGDLVVRAGDRKWVLPRYWLRGGAQAAQRALDERLQHERRKIGASLAR